MDALAQFKTKTTKAATDHPVLPDPKQELAETVDEIVSLNEQAEAINAKIKDGESVLKSLVHSWFFKHYSGKSEVPSSVKVQGISDAVLVQLTSRSYGVKVDPKNSDKIDQLTKLLGTAFSAAMNENIKFEIDGNQIAEENRERFMQALALVFRVFGHGAVDADEQGMFTDSLSQIIDLGCHDKSNGEMSEAIQVAQSITPKPSLHSQRHALMSPKDNAKMQELMPYVVSVKKKGVK